MNPWRHYGGGPGDVVILIRFAADRPTMAHLLRTRPLSLSKELSSREESGEERGDWSAFVNRLFSNLAALGGVAWREIPRMPEPEVYEWSSGVESVRLLWDARSGMAYAVYLLG